jgi:hypothetical protein
MNAPQAVADLLAPGEEARAVRDFPTYFVTSHGRVIAWHFNAGKHRRTEPSFTAYAMRFDLARAAGNLRVKLAGRRVLVSTIVARAFIAQPSRGRFVVHLDGHSENNRAENLQYMTTRQRYAHAKALPTVAYGERSGRAKLDDDKVRELRLRAARGESFMSLGRRFGISNVTATNAARGITWARCSS